MPRYEKKPKWVWVIAHVDGSLTQHIERDMARSNQYLGVKAIVPKIKIQKKQFKGKTEYSEVPLLFSYGFFKIPYLWAINPDMLTRLKDEISCISHWVQDKAKGRTELRVASVEYKEVKRLVKFAEETSIHDNDVVAASLQVGQIITLLGYPFSGLSAWVMGVDLKRREVEVKVQLSDEVGDIGEWASTRVIKVSFDNAVYSTYGGSYHDDYNREKTLSDYQNKKLQGDAE